MGVVVKCCQSCNFLESHCIIIYDGSLHSKNMTFMSNSYYKDNLLSYYIVSGTKIISLHEYVTLRH